MMLSCSPYRYITFENLLGHRDLYHTSSTAPKLLISGALKINLAQLSSHEDDASTWMVNEVPFLLFLALTKCLSIPHQGMAGLGFSFFFFATFRKSQLSCLVPFPYHIRLEREINYLKIGSPFTNAMPLVGIEPRPPAQQLRSLSISPVPLRLDCCCLNLGMLMGQSKWVAPFNGKPVLNWYRTHHLWLFKQSPALSQSVQSSTSCGIGKTLKPLLQPEESLFAAE